MGSLSKAQRAFLVVGPPLFLVLSAWCFSFALTFENCQRACISDGAELAVRLTSCLTGLMLVTITVLAVGAWLSKPRRERMTQLSIRIAVPGVTLFVVWFFVMISVSFSVTT
jgi:hypothetical protein